MIFLIQNLHEFAICIFSDSKTSIQLFFTKIHNYIEKSCLYYHRQCADDCTKDPDCKAFSFRLGQFNGQGLLLNEFSLKKISNRVSTLT